jgi:hypothetical protein
MFPPNRSIALFEWSLVASQTAKKIAQAVESV